MPLYIASYTIEVCFYEKIITYVNLSVQLASCIGGRFSTYIYIVWTLERRLCRKVGMVWLIVALDMWCRTTHVYWEASQGPHQHGRHNWWCFKLHMPGIDIMDDNNSLHILAVFTLHTQRPYSILSALQKKAYSINIEAWSAKYEAKLMYNISMYKTKKILMILWLPPFPWWINPLPVMYNFCEAWTNWSINYRPQSIPNNMYVHMRYIDGKRRIHMKDGSSHHVW